MGEHKGWTVAPLKTGKWLARVKIPGGPGRYRSQSFAKDEKRKATDWAKLEASVERLGVDPRHPAAVPALALARDYVARLRDLRRSESHCLDVERWLGKAALVVPDLAAPGATDAIERWLRSLSAGTDGNPPLSPATRNKVLVEVRGCCRWAVRRRKLTFDPTAALDQVSLPDPMPTVFTVGELRRLLIEVDDPYHRLFAVMTYTGMRVQEASGLHWEDVDWSGNVVAVRLRRGVRLKRERERIVPLQSELRAILEMSWPASRRRARKSAPKIDATPAPERRGPLFAGRGCNPFRGLANFLERCGVPIDGRSPHSCRHTYASLMTAADLALPMLMGYLGHSNIATTTIYTRTATRYREVAQRWERGVMEILRGVGSPLQRCESDY